MDRRTFLKTLLSLGASIVVPFDLANASPNDIDSAWQSLTQAWGLFEVNDYGTLSYANFEEPKTRRDAYWYAGASDFDSNELECRWSLCESIKDLYREKLCVAADELEMQTDERTDVSVIDQRVEKDWATWFDKATGEERGTIDAKIEDWLDEVPDWCNEWEDFYKTGNAQGAAYDHFLREDSEVMEALGIVVIEGDCPGSSYFAAELRIPIEDANQIAETRGWDIRFVAEGLPPQKGA